MRVHMSRAGSSDFEKRGDYLVIIFSLFSKYFLIFKMLKFNKDFKNLVKERLRWKESAPTPSESTNACARKYLSNYICWIYRSLFKSVCNQQLFIAFWEKLYWHYYFKFICIQCRIMLWIFNQKSIYWWHWWYSVVRTRTSDIFSILRKIHQISLRYTLKLKTIHKYFLPL